MRRAFLALIRRELRLGWRVGGGGAAALVFFLALVVLVPFGVGPDLGLTRRIGPAMLWIGALLAALLGLDRLLQADQDDGSLDVMTGAVLPLELILFAKALAHWLSAVLPLIVAAPLLAVMLGLEAAAVPPLLLALLIGSPALVFLGLIGAGLTVGLRRGGLLQAVLILPFTIPVLIFGVAAAGGATAPMGVLVGLSLGAAVLGPVAAAAGIRLGRS